VDVGTGTSPRVKNLISAQMASPDRKGSPPSQNLMKRTGSFKKNSAVMGMTPSAIQRINGSANAHSNASERTSDRGDRGDRGPSGQRTQSFHHNHFAATPGHTRKLSSQSTRTETACLQKPSPTGGNKSPAADAPNEVMPKATADSTVTTGVESPRSVNNTPPEWRPPPKIRLPSSVNELYSLGECIGRGAFGTVWQGTHRVTGDDVAIKLIERKRQLLEDFRVELNEVEILKTVNHPSIVTLKELWNFEEHVYLVMELVNGGQLQKHLTTHGPYDEGSARLITRQIFSAIDYSMGKGLLIVI